MRDFDYELLVNTTEADYSGKVLLNKKGKQCFFVIDSDREVTITPAE